MDVWPSYVTPGEFTVQSSQCCRGKQLAVGKNAAGAVMALGNMSYENGLNSFSSNPSFLKHPLTADLLYKT